MHVECHKIATLKKSHIQHMAIIKCNAMAKIGKVGAQKVFCVSKTYGERCAQSVHNHVILLPNKAKAKQITETIHHRQPMTIAHEQKLKKEIFTLQQRINNTYKNETQTLEKFIEATLDEFIEDEERKIELNYRPINVSLDKKAVHNLTDLIIPQDVQSAVSFGPKFYFDDDNSLFSMASFITDTTVQFENSCATETHLQCYKIISEELSKINRKEMITADTWMEFLKYRVRKFIKRYPDVLITRSDKGKHTIFIDKNDYISKMSSLISVNEDYIEIPPIDIV